VAKRKYTPSLAREMYCFFRGFDDLGAPSVAKFAASIGVTSAEIEKFRRHKEFDRAYRECCEIKRDYLIDRALSKRFDAGFVKFLLSSEDEKSSSEDRESLNITLTVAE